MEALFERLPDEKKKRILDACLEEFGINGYERTSTNSIVKRAGISKGALFSYFGNKKRLFLYLFDYSAEFLVDKISAVKCKQPSDLFERFIWYGLLKIRIFAEEPYISKLVLSSVTNMPEELKYDLEERINRLYAKNIPWFLENIDMSKFKEGIDPQKVLEFVSIFIEGMSCKYMKKYKGRSSEKILNETDKIIGEYNEYLEMLKHGIYKTRSEK